MGPLPFLVGGAAILLALATRKTAKGAPRLPAPTPAKPTTPQPVTPTPTTPIVHVIAPMGTAGGASSDQIRCVQSKLALLRSKDGAGYNVGDADGVWGAQTSLAVAHLQRDVGLPVSGSLDEATRKTEQLSGCFAAEAQDQGTIDPSGGANLYQIRCLQHAFNERYNAGLTEDGVYGPSLANAIRNYQAEMGQPMTGLISADLLQEVECAGAGPSNQGSQSDPTGGADARQIACIQQYANAHYGQSILIDGQYGTETANAIKIMQKDFGVPVNGYVTPDILARTYCVDTSVTAETAGASAATGADRPSDAEMMAEIDKNGDQQDLLDFAEHCMKASPPAIALHDYALARIVALRTGSSASKVLDEQKKARKTRKKG